MTVLYIVCNNTDTVEYYKNRSNYDTDSGVDLYVTEDVKFYPGETKFVNLNIKCKMLDKNDNSIAYYLYPRSSISKTPLRLANSVGIIDKDYRGNIIAALQYVPHNNFLQSILKQDKHDHLTSCKLMEEHEYTLKKGDKIVQICAHDLKPIKIILVDELDETIRGEGGFGSTN